MCASTMGPREAPPDGPERRLPDPHRPDGEPGPHLPPFEDPREGEPAPEPDSPKRERSRLRRLGLGALIALTATLGFASAAAAENCKEQVERFARQYDLAMTAPQAKLREGDPVTPPSPPMTQESRGLSASDKLKESGGVVQPPDTGAARVLPPPQTGDRMATAPDVQPQTEPGQTAGESRVLSGADRQKLEALVMGGLEAAENGQEQDCFARLGQAKAIAEPSQR